MGTEGISGFKCGGEYKVFNNQSNAFPDQLGDNVVKFVRKMQQVRGWDILNNRCLDLEVVPYYGGWTRDPRPSEKRRYKRYAWGIVGREESEHPFTSKELDNWDTLQKGLYNGVLLDEVYAGNVTSIQDGRGGAPEFGYIINLDDGELEFYLSKTRAELGDIETIRDPTKLESPKFVGSCKLYEPYFPTMGCRDWKEEFFGE